jgi:hypothetical protein
MQEEIINKDANYYRAIQLLQESERKMQLGMNDLAHCCIIEAMHLLGYKTIGEINEGQY